MGFPLQTFRLKTLIADLRDLEIAISDRIRHVKMLQQAGENIEARTALDSANKLDVCARDLELYLSRFAAEAESMSRSVSHRPPAQIGIGRFEPSNAGMLSELRPTIARIAIKLRDLSAEVKRFSVQSNRRLNTDVARYGSAAVPNPVNDLAEVLGGILDLVAKFMRKRRHT